MNIYGWYFLFMNFMFFLTFCYTIVFGSVYKKTLKRDRTLFDFYVREFSFWKLFKFNILLPIAFIMFNYSMLLRDNGNLINIPTFRIFFNI